MPEGRLVVVCVDDEKIVLDRVKEQLRRGVPGVLIETAESAEEALEVLEELAAEGVRVPQI
jgi:CheY-like chemotaxis protein